MNYIDWSHSMPTVFDAYGTLFDFNAAIARHRAAAGPDTDRFSELWRQKQLEYTDPYAGRPLRRILTLTNARSITLRAAASVDQKAARRSARRLSQARRLP
jgi:FMN phosphatase YigB (HAD superfamily)